MMTRILCGMCGDTKQQNGYPCPQCRPQVRISERIHAIRIEIQRLSDELFSLVVPAEDELKSLREDVELNPEIYMSYLIDDPLFQAENILDEREVNDDTQS